MTTMTIKYDKRNKTVNNSLSGLIYSGIIHSTDAREARIAEFKSALHEIGEIVKNIAVNGTGGYKTLDDLLNED
jgi:hypothetical protein